MDLPNLLNRIRHKEEMVRRLLAIEIAPTAIKSAVWQVHGSRTEVVAVGSIQAWETDDLTDLITAVDTSLSEALAGLEGEPNEVIIGLPETWVSDTGIAEGKKPIVKQVLNKLGLKPVGFVVTIEALIQHLRDLEGGPPSAILINIGSDNVAISIVYLGHLQGTQVVGRSNSISSDVEEGLARFPHVENLPSRMILYDSREDLESAKQDLISHDWQAHLPFLHIPKIESLAKDFSIRAIAQSGGQEVAQSLGYTSENPIVKETETVEEESLLEQTPPKPEPDPIQPEENITNLSESTNAFGFETVTIDKPSPPTVVVATHSSQSLVNHPLHPNFKKPSLKIPVKPFFSRLSQSIVIILSKFPRIQIPSAQKVIFIPIILFLILGGIGFTYWNFLKATVVITVSSQPLTKTLTFTLDPQISVLDVQNNLVPAKKEAVRVSDSQNTATSGVKTVGDRASGIVTVYNRTNSPKNFSAGTTLKYQNFRYTLDKDITLASASTKYNPDFSVTTEPSKTTVAVTAVDIGESYNLGVNTQFSIANFSIDSFVGSNASPFAGGSSRQVAAVAESDRKKLKDALTSQLVQAVVGELKTKYQNKQIVATNKQTVVDEKYSAKVGDETDSLGLNMTLEQLVYLYDLTDVSLLSQHLAAAEMLPNYRIEANETKVNLLTTTVNDDNTATVKADTSLSLTPILNTASIAQNIQGKSVVAAKQSLSSLTGYVDSEITIKPRLPGFLYALPKKASNITITVAPKK